MTICLCIAVLLAAGNAPQPPSKDEIAALAARPVARVGGHEITALDFRRELEYQWELTRLTTGRMPQDTRQVREDVMRELIDNALLQVMAEKEKIDVSDGEVEKELAKHLHAFSTAQAFQAYLDRNGYTVAELREQLRHTLAGQHLIEQKTAGLTASEQDILRAYGRERMTGVFNRPKRTADIKHIYVRADKKDTASFGEAEAKIRAAYQRIKDGEAFEKVAKEVSEDPASADNGGSLYESMPGRILKEYAERIFVQPVGKVSEPFPSDIGWHILKVVAINEPGVIPLEKVRPRIVREILDPQRAEIVGKLLDDARKEIEVKRFDEPDATTPQSKAATP